MATRKKILVRGLYLLLAIVVVLLVVIFSCDAVVRSNANGKLFNSPRAIVCQSRTGLLLGTSPNARFGGPNEFFVNRIAATMELYNAGVIDRLVISGDSCSLDSVDETTSMRDSLVKRGFPIDRIIRDTKGFSTKESIDNAFDVYHLTDFVIISQKFHNERALYLADHRKDRGDGVICGYNARDSHSKFSIVVKMREYLARVKVIKDVYL